MSNLIHKKIVLCLLDCAPKSANEIADEIGESPAVVADQLTTLVSENICEKATQDEVGQYAVRKDIEAFAQLAQQFLSHKEEHDEQIKQFITSEYYFTRIDFELVTYVLRRFYLDSVYQTDEAKEEIRRILLASPSALLFALHGDTTIFSELRSGWDQLDSSGETRDWFTQILYSQFMTPLLEKLIADMRVTSYSVLYAKLQLRVAMISIQVGLATPDGKYVAAIGEKNFSLIGKENFSLPKAAETLRAGQLIWAVDPMTFAVNGLAFLHLGNFQAALENFNKALNALQDPIQKAKVLNNKGLTFLNSKQYQKAVECFKEGIAFDAGGEIPVLRENKQIAEEYLTRATDADNLSEPTQIRFVQAYPVPFEETRFYEFKEIKGGNAARSIADTSDVYVVAFLNREGGRIFWGVRDSDRITVGVILDEQQRNNVRRKVSEKLGAIRPPISVEDWHLEFHNVFDTQGKTSENLWVIELLVSVPQRRDIFYTSKGQLHVKTDGGKKKLSGPEITEFIRRHFQNNTETA